MQICATMHSSTLSTALMSMILVSAEFVPVEPVVRSACASAAPAKNSVPKLPHIEQHKARKRLIPLPPSQRQKDLGKAADSNVSDDPRKITQLCCHWQDEPTMNDARHV